MATTSDYISYSSATHDAAAQRRELSQRIKERAFSEGFEKVGIVAAEKLDLEHDRLLSWLSRGYHGNMAWMARDPEMRTDPRKLFPAARSVVVVALNYYTPDVHVDDPATGKVSRYAWGDDYHEVVSGKLRSLLEWIQQQAPGSDRESLRRYPTDDGQSLGSARRPGLDWQTYQSDHSRIRFVGFYRRVAAEH